MSLTFRCCCSCVLLVLIARPLAVLAAPFVNLNFEQATIPPGTPAGGRAGVDRVPGVDAEDWRRAHRFRLLQHVWDGRGRYRALRQAPSRGVSVFEGSYTGISLQILRRWLVRQSHKLVTCQRKQDR